MIIIFWRGATIAYGHSFIIRALILNLKKRKEKKHSFVKSLNQYQLFLKILFLMSKYIQKYLQREIHVHHYMQSNGIL